MSLANRLCTCGRAPLRCASSSLKGPVEMGLAVTADPGKAGEIFSYSKTL